MTTADINVRLAEARLLALVAQRLDDGLPRPPQKTTAADLLETIQHIGCVQLDTISVVARTQETTMWSRHGGYDPRDLARLHFPDGELIEYWAHAAALVPLEFFPYFRRHMARYADPEQTQFGRWAAEQQDLIDHVLTTIEHQGPLTTRAFERPPGAERSPWAWFGGKPAKQALDYLWTRGDLVILRRNGFERVYELTARLLPGARSAPLPDENEQRRFFATRALRALGIATPAWITDYFRSGARSHLPVREAATTLADLERDGLALPIDVAGLPGPLWLDPALLPVLTEIRAGGRRPRVTTLLSPFDNLVWHRARALTLFGFDYRLESYTPAPKRIYGYYTLPILHRGQIVGRLDPVYRRKERQLTVHAVHLEPGIRPGAGLATAIAGALGRYLAFLGGGEIVVSTTTPPALLPLLQQRL